MDVDAKKYLWLLMAKFFLIIVVVVGAVVWFFLAGPEALMDRPDTSAQAQELADDVLSMPEETTADAPVPAEDARLDEQAFSKLMYDFAGEEVTNIRFAREDGKIVQLSDYRGKIVLLNFWATWCVPCVLEMPTLDALEKAFGGKDFEVVALSWDRKEIEAVVPFYDRNGIDFLRVYVDRMRDAQNKMNWGGLPATVLIDRDGREIWRLLGPANWFSEEAKNLIRQAISK